MLSVFHVCVDTEDTEKKGGPIMTVGGPIYMTPVGTRLVTAAFSALAAIVFFAHPARAQRQQIVWTEQEKPIVQQLRGLRQMPDATRAEATTNLALAIRQLPASMNKLTLASHLANLSTEGDFGHDSLQEVATTLAAALREHPLPDNRGQPAAPYIELAELVRYDRAASLDSAQFTAAMSKLITDDQQREQADFTLKDLEGENWSLQHLHGKVVLVNFWATWCPPCRKEMPDSTRSQELEGQGFVILAISDEDIGKVKAFITQRHIAYPILLDPGSKVHQLFQVDGIPKSFVYNREGKLVTESIDMRTRRQFLEMLAQAGVK